MNSQPLGGGWGSDKRRACGRSSTISCWTAWTRLIRSTRHQAAIDSVTVPAVRRVELSHPPVEVVGGELALIPALGVASRTGLLRGLAVASNTFVRRGQPQVADTRRVGSAEPGGVEVPHVRPNRQQPLKVEHDPVPRGGEVVVPREVFGMAGREHEEAPRWSRPRRR